MRWISSLLLFFATTALGIDRRAEFCVARESGELSETLQRISADPAMRLSFRNSGGLANGGVCWWHSRFQRSAWYLANFDETGNRPSLHEARKMIHALVARNEVVTIPGYRDLQSFSREYRKEIQSALNLWQIRDGFLNQSYFRGLSGRARFLHAEKMRRRMENLYSEYLSARPRGDLLWLLLQMPGIVSHSSLLREMSPTGDGGFQLKVVDSNFPTREVEYDFRPGDLELVPSNISTRNYTSVPYAGFSRDLRRIHRAISSYCDTTR